MIAHLLLKNQRAMDENDPIPDMYYLDVASPGAERPIKKKRLSQCN